MKFLGIDYGAKRVGIALSDEGGKIAFPKDIIINDKNLLTKIAKIAKEEKVEKIVLGESLTSFGDPNKIMEEILSFKGRLENSGFSLELEKEFMTSLLARMGPLAIKPVATPRRKERKTEAIDAKAAALILQRYLDRINK
ncbi:MAG TPA: Holliday junction resolvase RuvX [Candidatus Paceibacterota bacterium]|nr:Holliday junction resolvase RuvX [Candidatus Paceibacterota bacterium]